MLTLALDSRVAFIRRGPRPAFASCVLTLAACSGHARGGTTAASEADFVRGASGSARLTYRPEVLVVERARGLAALRGASRDGLILLFDANADDWRRSTRATCCS